MLESEDIPTQHRPPTPPPAENEAGATIEVPVEPQPSAAKNEEVVIETSTHPEPASPAIASEQEQPEAAPEPEHPAEQPEASETSEQQPEIVAEQPEAPEQQKQPVEAPARPPFMNVEDLIALRVASDPRISPAGTYIAFTLMACDKKKNSTGSAIWLINVQSGKADQARQLTSGAYNDSQPRWSPNGQALTFLSDRTGSSQIYLLPMDGGEPRQLSSLSQGVSEYSWRPDGSSLLAHSAWKPADDDPTTANTAPSDEVNVYKRLDAHWDGAGYKQDRYQQLWLVPLQGAAQRLTSEPVDLVQSCWSPDGNEVVFCANRRTDPDLSVSMALWVLTVTTGTMRRLTPEDGLAQVPSWSPDGSRIAYLYTADQTESGNYAPWIVAADGNSLPHEAIPGAGALNCQTWIVDELRSEWLAPPQWSLDSQSLLVSVQSQGQVHAYRLHPDTQLAEQLTRGNGRYLSPNASGDGRVITLIRADWFTPGDIWSMDSRGQNLRKLTGVNDDLLHSRQLIRPRRINWTGHDGLSIEGWLYLPPLSDDARAPLILAPHGGPSLAWGDAYVHEFQVLAGRGYAVLAPNPRGSAGYGEDFGRKVLNDWGGDDWRDLEAGLDHVIASEAIDEQRLGIGGLSYGGYMTNWAITRTQRFKAAVSRNGISSLLTSALLSDQTIWFNLSLPDELLRRSRSALTHVAQITTPLLLLHAANDLRCPFNEAFQIFVALRRRKQAVELVRYTNTSHLMDWPGNSTPAQRADRLSRTLAWFEHYI